MSLEPAVPSHVQLKICNAVLYSVSDRKRQKKNCESSRRGFCTICLCVVIREMEDLEERAALDSGETSVERAGLSVQSDTGVKRWRSSSVEVRTP